MELIFQLFQYRGGTLSKKITIPFAFAVYCAVPSLLAAVAEESPIDDSSYESLFKIAHKDEQGHSSGWDGYYFHNDSLNTLVQFRRFDLLFTDVAPYSAGPNEGTDPRRRLRNAISLASGIAERLFREGQIEEGLAFLRKMLPPQNASDGMLASGYVSESLLEQKRFDLAWDIVVSGPLRERSENIVRYIRRTMAKTYRETDATPSAMYTLISGLPPYVPKQEDVEIYRAEAARALEHLLQLSKQLDEEDAKLIRPLIPKALAAAGRSEEAYALLENERGAFEVLRMILFERRQNATQEDVDYWFAKLRKLYDEKKLPRGFDYPSETSFIWPCFETGKYLDALDVIEKHAEKSGENSNPRVRTSGDPDGYFDQIPRLNVKTDFRYNSKELIERMIRYHDRTLEDTQGESVKIQGKRVNLFRQNRFQFFPLILKSQLNLGLLEDAFVSFSRMEDTHEALEPLVDIAVYCAKNMPEEEAKKRERDAIRAFRKLAAAHDEDSMAEFYLVDFYAQTAVRLMNDGETALGTAYLNIAIQKAEEETFKQEKKDKRRLNSYCEMERVCGILVTDGYLDEAVQIAERIEGRYLMPAIHLNVAIKRAELGETEKAKRSLRKAVAQIAQIKAFFHPLDYKLFGRMAKLATELEEKELFEDIFTLGRKVAQDNDWNKSGNVASEPLGTFARVLAQYGDKNHPFFKDAEKIADAFPEMNRKADLYFNLGVSRAMLDDHIDARRLQKKGIQARRKDPFKALAAYCPAILEASSHERVIRKYTGTDTEFGSWSTAVYCTK